MKKIVSIILATAMLVASLTAFATDVSLNIGSDTAIVDGVEVTLDNAPVDGADNLV